MAINGGLENALRAWRKASHRLGAKAAAARLAELELKDAAEAEKMCMLEVARHVTLTKQLPCRYVDLGEGFIYRLSDRGLASLPLFIETIVPEV